MLNAHRKNKTVSQKSQNTFPKIEILKNSYNKYGLEIWWNLALVRLKGYEKTGFTADGRLRHDSSSAVQ